MNLKLYTKHYSIPLPAMDCEQDFAQFAKELNGEVIGKDVLQLSGGLAKGLVKKERVKAGCCLRAWNMVFNHPVELFKPGNQLDNKSFTVVYVLTPGCCRLKSIAGHEQFNPTETRNTLMVANGIDLRYDIVPFQPVQVIEISMNSFWLAQQFQKAGLPLENLLGRINEKEDPLILSNICTTSVINHVNMLFDLLMSSDHDATRTAHLSTSLILDFLNKALNSRVPQSPGNNDAHFIKVMEAEAILQAHLQRNLPNVYAIAQQVALSESTLKRHFKIIFGKSLYEYYLEKKMNLAKTLLLEQPLTVYQAASKLGYEKVSNFIWIFKKHHGYSPGSIKKRGLSNM
jgi:AraC-like DNA-binding protein